MDELLEYYAEHEPTVVNIQMRNYFDKKDKKRHFKVTISSGSDQFLKFQIQIWKRANHTLIRICNTVNAAYNTHYYSTILRIDLPIWLYLLRISIR